MKTFTIEKETNHITLHATVQDAEAVANAECFSSDAELAKLAADWPGAQLIQTWNNLPGAIPVKKFKDRATAVSRIWNAVQSVGEEPKTATPETPELALVTPQTPNVAPETVLAKTKASGAAKQPKPATKRESSKTEAILVLMKEPGGVTLKAIMEATNWQAHSVRGFISGTLGKKMGLTVLSTKAENGERRYSIPS